ncbi:MAG: extracellular solute-binding protein, partial [Lentisphaerae bacterium]|nr:extracellular solute-binding protein [Lentisphaerota bacterium]
RIVDAAWPVLYREADTDRAGVPRGKHVWALPYGQSVRALLYRKDVFNEAGLDPERPPRDWNEFLDYSRKIRALPGKFGFMYSTGIHVSWGVYSFMVSNGVRYMEKGADGRWRAAFNTPAAAETIYYLLELTRQPFETEAGDTYSGAVFAPLGGGQEMDLKWQRGEIGMRFSYLTFGRGLDINPALVGIAPAPASYSGESASELNCGSTGVFSGSTPEQQLGVMRYIWFQTGEQAERIRTRMFIDAGYGTFLDPDVLAKYGYDDVLKQVPEDWKNTVRDALRNGVPEPYGKNTQTIYEYVSEPINWALERPELLQLPRDEALRRIGEQLDRAAQRVDKFLLGELTPREWRIRRLAGGCVLALIVVIFALSIRWVWRAFSRQEQALGDQPSFRRMRHAYLMILPGLALVLFVSYLPLALGVPLALLDFQLVLESGFVGIDNFAAILWDARFWMSLGRTFYYALLVVGFGFWPPILVAILLDEVPTQTLKYFFRTIFYLPAIVSGIIMVFLWRQFYEPSETGFLNQIFMSVNRLGPVSGTVLKLTLIGCWLSLVAFIFSCAVKLKELSWPVRAAVAAFALALLGATLWPLLQAWVGPGELVITAQQLDPAQVTGWNGLRGYLAGLIGPFQVKPLGWIEDPGMAMFSVVLPMVWASAGPGCIIYLAALKTVPEDLIEAATIDGAGIIQRISYITLPRIKFLILIQLMSALIGAFKGGTDFIMVMTGGGPNGATRTLGLDIFQRAWMELKFSTGAAMGWILGAVVIILTCQQLRRMSRATFTNAAQIEANKETSR